MARAIDDGARPAATAGSRRDVLAAAAHRLTDARRGVLVFATAAVAILFVQAPVLRYYFFNDDFVPLADIATRTAPGYVKDLFLMRDLTPNWRFLTGVYYLGAYRAFGLHATPYFVVSVAVHLGTAGLIFRLVRRALGSDWPAWFAAVLFGVSAATVPTVSQITAFNNVLAAFFVMLAIVLLYEGMERSGGPGWWLAAPAGAFAGAIAANESTLTVAPVFGLIVLWKTPQPAGWWRRPAAWIPIALMMAPFAVMGIAGAAGFGACRCTEANKEGVSSFGGHMWGTYGILLGRLLYPIGLEVPGEPGAAHVGAAIAVAVVAGTLLVRGPGLARVFAPFLFLALLPNTMITFALAERYTYLATVPFAVLAALFARELARAAQRVGPAGGAVVAVAALGVLGVNGWQTWSQNHWEADATGRWRSLVTAVRDAYPDVPPETVVYVRGGPVTEPLSQCAVMPAVAHVLWGSDRLLFTVPPDQLQSFLVRPGYHVLVGDYAAGRIAPVATAVATEADLQRKDVELLPGVSPEATGNICAVPPP